VRYSRYLIISYVNLCLCEAHKFSVTPLILIACRTSRQGKQPVLANTHFHLHLPLFTMSTAPTPYADLNPPIVSPSKLLNETKV
jgi:hypothetical protein